jgi:acyl-CoA synthetase (AMP-forming)/AMP-acid ligase II
MEIPLTPLDFARRARRLYSDREAVVDGHLRLTYREFFERCDRWSSALQSMGIQKGDRVAYISPNTHSHLEAYYAVPQTGAVLVPINYRLIADVELAVRALAIVIENALDYSSGEPVEVDERFWNRLRGETDAMAR